MPGLRPWHLLQGLGTVNVRVDLINVVFATCAVGVVPLVEFPVVSEALLHLIWGRIPGGWSRTPSFVHI